MDIPSLLAQLATPSHAHRLLQLDAPHAGLVVERFSGQEHVCGDVRFVIDCLSTDAHLDINPWLEQPLTLYLHQANGQRRQWHGLCQSAAQLGSDGGLARYRLTLAPWTALLQLRRNAVIFQDQNVRSICETVFADYPQAVYRFDVQETLPVHAITTQYRESDWAFVTRLLSEVGLAWRIEQTQGGTAAHTLVIFDPAATRPELGNVRFHRAHASEEEDGVTAFAHQQQWVPTASTVGSWHSEQVQSNAAQASAETGSLPALEVYVQPRAGRFSKQVWAQDAAQARLDALRVPHTLFAGSSSLRHLAAGAHITLQEHPQWNGQTFQLLALEHVAVNNLEQGIAELLDAPELERGSYRNRFIAAPAATPIRPLPHDRPTAHGLQTARVVGLPDAAVSPNRDHQVHIQFGWQRGAQPNPGGLADTGSKQPGHAPGDHTSGTWVPVSEWVAGPNWGSAFLPRIGSEVLVEFLHGDIDQPRIIGQLYNGDIAPPFGGGVDAVQPGVLSGLHTSAHDSSHTQQWVVDDTPSQLRTRLHTSLADSRLELGHLIRHQQTTRGGLRGSGFELGSCGWGNVHAGQGLLLSATARATARSTVLDTAETVAQLKGAERSLDHMHSTLKQQQVPGLDAWQHTKTLRKQIDPKALGKFQGNVNDQPALKPEAGRRLGTDPVERFASPVLLAETPEHLVWVTPASAAVHAGQQLQLAAQHDLHASAAYTLSSVSGQHASLFTQAQPLRIIAANGPVTLQAHDGELELLADQAITITATDNRIDVLAKTKITLQAGRSAIVLEGGNITFTCPGQFTVKAGMVPFVGPVNSPVPLKPLPINLADMFNEQFHLVTDESNEPLVGISYRIKSSDGQTWEGITNEDGLTERVYTRDSVKLTVEVFENSKGRLVE